LEQVAATLGKPEAVLRLEPISLTLDHMNTKVPPHSARVANTLVFDEMVLAEVRRVIALFIRFPSDEILPQPDVFAETRRFL
ncbi:MAG TPA: hypothetical protein VES89_11895, partial [Candidatus Competibacteraceae bacterium]|nr:hypothetical protein [Candidatus Competibacteraceae bacterium]